MAIITLEQSYPILGTHDFAQLIWRSLSVSDVGEPFILSQYADRSVQVLGIFGVGGTVVIEGSNDGINYHTLNNPQGNPLSIGLAKMEAVSEIVYAIRPRIVGGDGTTNITVNMLVRKSK